MRLWERSSVTQQTVQESGGQEAGRVLPPWSWELLPALAEPSPFCLEVSLLSLGLLPLLFTEEPGGRTCPALIVHLPVEAHGVYCPCVHLSWGAQGRGHWSVLTPHVPGMQMSCHGSQTGELSFSGLTCFPEGEVLLCSASH